MIGRSSRSRGVCNGTYFTIGEEKAVQVMNRLRKHGVVNMQDQERLLMLLARKHKDQTLLKRLKQGQEEGKHIQTY